MQKIKYNDGFTLIELTITMLILGIISTVAYSSYKEQIKKARRSGATQSLLKCSALLERKFTVNNTFENNICNAIDTQNKHYTITTVVTGQVRTNRNCSSVNGNENCYLVTASVIDQSFDAQCKTMGINELGQKSVNGAINTNAATAAAVAFCWGAN